MFIFKRARPAASIRKNTAAQNAALARLDAFLDTATPQLVHFLRQMFQDQQAAITYKELREAWLDGYEQEIRQWQEDYAKFVEERLSPMWEIAMRNGAQQWIDRLKERGILVYDDSDHDVRSWLQRHTGEFIANIGEGTRQAIRSIVMHGQSEGWTADQMARTVRPCIGLTRPQAMANVRYQQSVYEALLEAHPRMREETAARKAQEAALKYAAKQHRLRADTIANTELAYAYNMGAHESVRQAMKQNLMGPCEKVWSTAADARVCERCKALSGKRVGFDEGFPGGNRMAGYAIVPPAHPRCRCAVVYEEISAPAIKPLKENPANGTIKPEKDAFVPAKTIKEANAYATDVLGIPRASYKGCDVETANEWNRGLKDSFDRFPELKKNFGFVGEAHERRELYKQRIQKWYEDELRKKYPHLHADNITEEAKKRATSWMRKTYTVSKTTYATSWNKISGNIDVHLSGVVVNKEYGKNSVYFLDCLARDVASKHHPEGCDTIRSVLDHEIGHQLDTLLGISKMAEVQKLIISLTNEQITTNLSRYSWKNGNSNPHREFIAEAWAEYCNNPNPRPIAKTIGELIESEYRKKFG